MRGRIADQVGAVHVIQDSQEAEAQHDVPMQLSCYCTGSRLLFLSHSKQQCNQSITLHHEIILMSGSKRPSQEDPELQDTYPGQREAAAFSRQGCGFIWL